MKRILVLLFAVLPLMAPAQTKPVESWSDLELATFARSYTLGTPLVTYDTIAGERVTYSGIAVQLFRAPQALQLFNPWAPRAYGPSEQNLVFDPLTKRPAGLRLFAINF
jgi:hypothetical protein